MFSLKIKSLLALALLFILFLPSCASTPRPVFELKPERHKWDSVWVQGREFVKLDNDSLEVIVAFDEINDGIASFDVEISNNSARTINVSNSLFKILNLDKNKALKSESYSIDPEKMIIKYKLIYSAENARYESENNAKLVGDLFDLAGDVATASSKQTKKERRANNRYRENRDTNKKLDDISDEETHEKNKTSILTEKRRWSFSALRKTTLAPGFTAKGKVYFKINLKSRFISFIVINNQKLKLIFELEKYLVSSLYRDESGEYTYNPNGVIEEE